VSFPVPCALDYSTLFRLSLYYGQAGVNSRSPDASEADDPGRWALCPSRHNQAAANLGAVRPGELTLDVSHLLPFQVYTCGMKAIAILVLLLPAVAYAATASMGQEGLTTRHPDLCARSRMRSTECMAEPFGALSRGVRAQRRLKFSNVCAVLHRSPRPGDGSAVRHRFRSSWAQSLVCCASWAYLPRSA